MHVNEPANFCSSCQRLVQTAQCELLTENLQQSRSTGEAGPGCDPKPVTPLLCFQTGPGHVSSADCERTK